MSIDALVRKAHAGDPKAYRDLQRIVPARRFNSWRIPEPRKAKGETVAEWLRKDLAKRAIIPGLRDGWKETAWAKSHFRILRDGEPLYFAPYVADWAPWMKRALCRGSESHKDRTETQRQLELLFPAQTSVRNFGRLLTRCKTALAWSVTRLVDTTWEAEPP